MANSKQVCHLGTRDKAVLPTPHLLHLTRFMDTLPNVVEVEVTVAACWQAMVMPLATFLCRQRHWIVVVTRWGFAASKPASVPQQLSTPCMFLSVVHIDNNQKRGSQQHKQTCVVHKELVTSPCMCRIHEHVYISCVRWRCRRHIMYSLFMQCNATTRFRLCINRINSYEFSQWLSNTFVLLIIRRIIFNNYIQTRTDWRSESILKFKDIHWWRTAVTSRQHYRIQVCDRPKQELYSMMMSGPMRNWIGVWQVLVVMSCILRAHGKYKSLPLLQLRHVRILLNTSP